MNNASQLIPSVTEGSDTDNSISRRDAIKHLAIFCGLALSASSLSALAAVVSSPTDMNRSKQTLLDKNQLALVRELGEIIIPTTDTPGAITAGVHDFINHFVVYCASKDDQQLLLDFLTRIERSAQDQFKQPFLLLDKKQQGDLLNNMEQATNGFGHNDRKAFKQFKALVVFGYYTSEIGASQELAYLAIPGGYKGNFKFKEIGRAWALPM
ncbi:MAG TPA: gluconate 2-dehydrogenase subunit 3 family protein [Cellvibrio sp.]|nr:gluconate 2-dehydrogenase subunit 3 family protein [Cellvibrio sp.]